MTRFHDLTPSTLSREAFVSAFADIYEHSPWVADQTWERYHDTPLDSVEELHARMSEVLLSADHAAQLGLINAHPDLAGKAAVAGQLTAASSDEQSGAGIHLCTPAEFQRFNELNDAYKSRFGFPFIMAVKGSDRHQIIQAFETRIHNSADREFACALAEINRIALFRLLAL